MELIFIGVGDFDATGKLDRLLEAKRSGKRTDPLAAWAMEVKNNNNRYCFSVWPFSVPGSNENRGYMKYIKYKSSHYVSLRYIELMGYLPHFLN